MKYEALVIIGTQQLAVATVVLCYMRHLHSWSEESGCVSRCYLKWARFLQVPNFNNSASHGKVMEFEWLISRPGEVMEILKTWHSDRTWKCDIPSNTLIYTHITGPLLVYGWVQKGHGISHQRASFQVISWF